MMNRMEIGKDGKTAYERIKGKKATVLGVEFGEKLLYKVKDGAKMAKARGRWEYAIFVGVRRRSGEVWLAADGKVFNARSLRRIPKEDGGERTASSGLPECRGTDIRIRQKQMGTYRRQWKQKPDQLEDIKARASFTLGKRCLGSFTSKKKIVKSTDIPEDVEDAATGLKDSLGNHTREHAEEGSGIS